MGITRQCCSKVAHKLSVSMLTIRKLMRKDSPHPHAKIRIKYHAYARGQFGRPRAIFLAQMVTVGGLETAAYPPAPYARFHRPRA